MKDATSEHIDHQRWLINNNLANDLHKNTLFMYGAIVHRDVKAVELKLEFSTRSVQYTLYFDAKVLKMIELYRRLSASKSIIGLWRFKRLINKEGNLNLQHLLNTCVKAYCGANWHAELHLRDYTTYEEGFNRETESSQEKDRSPH